MGIEARAATHHIRSPESDGILGHRAENDKRATGNGLPFDGESRESQVKREAAEKQGNTQQARPCDGYALRTDYGLLIGIAPPIRWVSGNTSPIRES